MHLQDIIKQQEMERKSKRKCRNKVHNEISTEIINLDLTKLWNSNNENDWDLALERYWFLIKPGNLIVEMKMEDLDPKVIKKFTVDEFYNFLSDEYFFWKYTAKNRLATTRKQLERYKKENRLTDLEKIKEQLFSFDVRDTKKGLEIVTEIHGLGTAGASGLLALLFPKYYGTVDQFLVKALISIEYLKGKQNLKTMNPESIKLAEAVNLIEIMKEKADMLNKANNTDYWMPRHIDKVLWTFGR